MPRSMTGFGAAEGAVSGGRLRLEVRTVNHRHLNVQLRVPSELADLEAVGVLEKKRLSELSRAMLRLARIP